eukprot:211174-Amorphochlora_amoeboformis.AAC.1
MHRPLRYNGAIFTLLLASIAPAFVSSELGVGVERFQAPEFTEGRETVGEFGADTVLPEEAVAEVEALRRVTDSTAAGNFRAVHYVEVKEGE